MSPKMNSEQKQMDDKPYQSILGSVMWGQLVTQPDLSFSVSGLVCFQANPRINHWKALMHVIGYIKILLIMEWLIPVIQTSYPMLMWTLIMGDARILIVQLLDMYLSWPVDLLPGVVNAKPLLHFLWLKLNMWLCPDAHNKWFECITGYRKYRWSTLCWGWLEGITEAQ